MVTKPAAKAEYNKSAKAQEAAAQLPKMDLDAQNLAGLIYGLRKKNKAGHGTEFHKFRHFQNGIDDPRKIDWKSSAKSRDHDGNDILFLRDREMEVAQNIYLWRDTSASMDFKAPVELFANPPAYTKREAADILLLAAAYLAVKTGEHFALLGGNTDLNGNKPAIERMKLEMEHSLGSANPHNIPKLPIHRGKPLLPGSHVFIFSDFLCPLREIAAMIDNLHYSGLKGHMIQILDPAEIEFRYQGKVNLKGLENESPCLISNGQTSRHEIEQRIHQHVHDIEQMVKNIPGWNYSTYITDQPLYEAMLPLYGLRASRMPKPTQNFSTPSKS